MDKIPTHREKYTEILKPWLEGDFEEIEETDTSIGAGRPRIITSPKVMAEIALKYFVNAAEIDDMFIQEELIHSFGLSNYSSFDLYKEYSNDFKELISMIKSIIKVGYIKMLQEKKFLGAQFILKSCYGWAETTHQIIEDRVIVVNVKDPSLNKLNN